MSQGAAPIILLATEKGRTFPETGLVVLRESHGIIRRERGADHVWSSRDIDANRTYEHESVHFLQALTCGYLLQHALRYVDACIRTLGDVGNPSEKSRDVIAAYRAMTWDRAHDPGKDVDVRETKEGVLIVPVGAHETISVADILEGMAELAAFQRTTKNATAADYVRELSVRYGGQDGPEYWNSFEYVAGMLGLDEAYACLCPLSFVALNTGDPAATYTALVASVKEKGNPTNICADLGALFELAGGRMEDHVVFRVPDSDNRHRHPTLTPCLEHVLQHMSPEALLGYAANPGCLDAASEDHLVALNAPVIVMSSDRGGKVTTELTGLAKVNRPFAEGLIHWTAWCGAAERLLFPTQDRYQFCPHVGCEHYETALCFRYFTPPSVERGPEQCQFPVSFEMAAQMLPKAAWAGIGFDRKGVDELVAEFKATGEAGLLELTTRRKASIIAWLGRDGFVDLEWKARETAKKAIRAMQTNKIDHLIEARAFRDAVVNEVAQRAAGYKNK